MLPRFQSTLPRGSDNSAPLWALMSLNFNPRSLAGATERGPEVVSAATFQSTLPRGSDLQRCCADARRKNFNPRSLAGATNYQLDIYRQNLISIHAPSRERHITNLSIINVSLNFNPRSLAGATPARQAEKVMSKFQSTLPRGSDQCLGCRLDKANISIHAPSRERQISLFTISANLTFQSTLPRGSDSIKMMYFYNYVNQAFVANKLN